MTTRGKRPSPSTSPSLQPAPAAPPDGGRAKASGRVAAPQPRWRLRRGVALVGMMGSGKTAIGLALAQRLRVPFLDSDAAIEEAAQARIAEIFARDGEAFFRDREHEVLVRLLSGPPAVVSTGGGAFMAARNRVAISAKGVSIWLDADLATLWGRVRHKDTRPLLRTSDPRATLAQLLAERAPVYALADLRVEAAAGASIEETTDAVIAALATRPDVLEEGA